MHCFRMTKAFGVTSASLRQPRYFAVPPACGMCGGILRGEAAGEFFRRVWVLQGGSRVNIPALARLSQPQTWLFGGSQRTHQVNPTVLVEAHRCLDRHVGLISALEPTTSTNTSVGSPSWPPRFSGVPAMKKQPVHTEALSLRAASGNMSAKLTEKFFGA